MAGKGAAPGERRGGRTAGVPNKSSIVKMLAIEALASPAGRAAVRASIAKVTFGDMKPVGRSEFAVDTLSKITKLFMGLAAKYQPLPDANGREMNAAADEDKFVMYLHHAQRAAASLAPYQSPTFKAVAVQESPALPAENVEELIGSMLTRSQQGASEVYARLVRGPRLRLLGAKPPEAQD